jgi:hypothetical protein
VLQGSPAANQLAHRSHPRRVLRSGPERPAPVNEEPPTIAGETLPGPSEKRADEIRDESRRAFAVERNQVEADIGKRLLEAATTLLRKVVDKGPSGSDPDSVTGSVTASGGRVMKREPGDPEKRRSRGKGSRRARDATPVPARLLRPRIDSSDMSLLPPRGSPNEMTQCAWTSTQPPCAGDESAFRSAIPDPRRARDRLLKLFRHRAIDRFVLSGTWVRLPGDTFFTSWALVAATTLGIELKQLRYRLERDLDVMNSLRLQHLVRLAGLEGGPRERLWRADR